MSKAQKLVNKALDVLLRRHQNHLNDQKALAEISSALERTEDSGTGTASERVKLARETMREHKENALTNQQAMEELRRIFAFVAPVNIPMSKHHHHPDEGHSPGNPPKSHLRHNWFFYLSGILIFIALLAFIVSGNLSWNFNTAAPQPKPLVGGAK